MTPNKKILAGINLSHLDEQVISFTALLSTIMQPATLIFYHVLKGSDETDTIEVKKTEVKRKVAEAFGETTPESTVFLVESGSPGDLLIKQSKEKDIDLMVMGRQASESNKNFIESLINASESSLFLVPENSTPKITNIVVGIDFSEESHLCLDTAVIIANKTGAEIHCLNIYHVPSGYHTSGRSYEEYSEIMKNNARKEAEKFEKKYKYDIPLNFDFRLDDDNDPADKLYEYAQKTNADLICVGSRGLATIAALFFDTTAEKIVEISNNIPMLVVKAKNKHRSFFDAIREL